MNLSPKQEARFRYLWANHAPLSAIQNEFQICQNTVYVLGRKYQLPLRRLNYKIRKRHPLVEQLYRVRLKQNLTQAQLADKIGIAPNTLSQYEIGRFCPPLWAFVAWAGALNQDVIVRSSHVPDSP